MIHNPPPATLTNGSNGDGLHGHGHLRGRWPMRCLLANEKLLFVDGDYDLSWTAVFSTTKTDVTSTYGPGPFGLESVLFSCADGQTSACMRLAFAGPVDIRNGEIQVAYTIPAGVTITQASILISSNTALWNSATAAVTNDIPLTAGMHVVTFAYEDLDWGDAAAHSDVGDTFDPSAATGLQLRAYVKSPDGTKGIVFHGMLIAKSSNATARVFFRFDDGLDEHYSVAAPYLLQNGFRGFFAAVGSYAGTNGYATWAQLREMRDMGHIIANHTYTHGGGSWANWKAMTDAQKVADFQLNRAAMVDNGLGEHADLLVIPFGWSGTSDTLHALMDVGAAIYPGHPFTRIGPFTHTSYIQGPLPGRPLDPHIIPRSYADDAVLTGATEDAGEYTAVPLLDTAVTNKRTFGTNMHLLDGSGSYLSAAEFQQYVRYVRTLVDAGTAVVILPTPENINAA